MASHCADVGMSDSKIRLLGRWKSDAFNPILGQHLPANGNELSMDGVI
jgi:hypothetical protein